MYIYVYIFSLIGHIVPVLSGKAIIDNKYIIYIIYYIFVVNYHFSG